MTVTNKSILLGALFTMFSLSSFAQLCTNSFYNGYWGQWKSHYSELTGTNWFSVYGNYSGFIIYNSYSHPSEYFFKFQINNYTPPTKEDIKFHSKNDIWYEYNGNVEYFINSDYPTIKSALMTHSFPYVENSVENIKRTAYATIKIAPYKDHPKVYNIWFEDVGIAIDLGTMFFKQ